MKKKLSYPFIYLFLIISLTINPEFLKFFTVDKEINLINLKIFLYFSSCVFFLFFIFFYINKKKLNFDKILNIILCFIIFFSSIFIIELLNYFFISQKNPNKNKIIFSKHIEFDAKYIYNSDGFRDKEFIKNNNQKIFLIGDSFVFGAAVDEQYTIDKFIEKEINNNKSENIDALNFGISGTAPDTYLNTLKKYIYLEPKKVVMFIYVDNDIGEVYLANKLSIIDNFLSKSKIITEINNFFFKENVFTNEFIEKFNLNEKYKNIFKDRLANPHLLSLRFRGDLHKHYENLEEIFNENFSFKNIILESKNLSNQNKAEFYLVLIPFKHQVKYDYVKFSRQNLGYIFDKDEIINDNLQKKFMRWCNQNNIKCLNLLPYLKKTSLYNYHMLDDHFNLEGNKFISRIVYDFIFK
ncbi:hypothetical protein HIMB114_00008710 [alpha proteobacterium HIMB114]|nr:hypothetical protein HIMB114_00008710 [alpha proteobacterium HIMB114]